MIIITVTKVAVELLVLLANVAELSRVSYNCLHSITSTFYPLQSLSLSPSRLHHVQVFKAEICLCLYFRLVFNVPKILSSWKQNVTFRAFAGEVIDSVNTDSFVLAWVGEALVYIGLTVST